MRLAGKVALITGAAAARPGELMGFGGACAHAFVREGAKVVITDVQDELGKESVQLMSSSATDIKYHHLDVTLASDWEAAIKYTLSTFGRIDILVNNAGTSGGMVAIEELPVEVWDTEMSVHAKGVFLGTKHVIPAMRKGGGGSIINVSSIMGIVGSPTSPVYTAAKGAIRLFTKSAAIQYASEKIRVNSVHPGYAITPMTVESFTQPEIRENLLAQTPMGRLGTAEDIAHGILYLASDESSFMTGAELVIDGGMIAK